jgi:hypothetical protein
MGTKFYPLKLKVERELETPRAKRCERLQKTRAGRDEPPGEDVAESLTGQFHKRFSEQFDLMIEGKSLDELKKYRSELISRGIAAGGIPDEAVFGQFGYRYKTRGRTHLQDAVAQQ